ncbi:MAG: (2Fe-2S)-binding protein [Verrucomicrobia bacterium]|nr:(2Fe-2S)-binding protein [Verrucomicrobiota bacterium]
MNRFSITIDGCTVAVSPGESVLSAARKLAIDIPTLCFLEKCGPLNTCQVCLVKLNGKLVPSCGTKVAPGMVVESETEEVHEARRTALELLFSDHVGDCLSPCHRLCPLMLNIPVMLRQIEAGQLDDAIATVRQALPLAGVLGRICHHPCEQGCRRGNWDDPAAIRDMEKFATDQDSKQPEPHVPPRKPTTGKSIAIIGAGPTGLAAAYYLACSTQSSLCSRGLESLSSWALSWEITSRWKDCRAGSMPYSSPWVRLPRTTRAN